VLRTSELVGLIGAVRRRDRAARPCEPALARLVLRLEPRRRAREDAALALDHDVADVGCGLAYERDTASFAAFDLAANPFSAGSRFAEAATSEYQPEAPIAWRCDLLWPRPKSLPLPLERELLVGRQPAQKLRACERINRQQFR